MHSVMRCRVQTGMRKYLPKSEKYLPELQT